MTRKIFVLIIAATAAAASCTKTDTVIQEETGAAGSEMEFAATVSDCMPSKATSGNTWDPGDETITVQVLDRYDPSASLSWDGAATGYYRAGTSALEFVSGEKSYWNGKDEEKMVRAWYLGTGEKRDRLPSADSPWTVSASQDTGDGFQHSDFVFAGRKATYGTGKTELTFYHQIAKITVNVAGSGKYAGAEISGMAIHGIYLGGTFEAPDITDGTVPAGTWTTSGQTGDIAMKKTGTASFEAIVIPQSGSPVQGRNLFTFSAGGTDFAYSPDGYTWKSGYRYTYNISIQEDGSVTITPPQSGLPGWGDESSEEVIQ